MLLDRIEEMRKKSYGERRRTTFLISFSLTAIIAFVWATVILPQTLTLDEAESSRAATASPFKTLAEDVGIVFGDIQTGVDDLGTQFNRLWNSSKGDQQEEVVLPTSPRDESSSIEITNEFSVPNTYTMDAEEVESAFEEETSINTEVFDETETELEIEG